MSEVKHTPEQLGRIRDAAPELLAALKEYVWGQATTLKPYASNIEKRRFRLDQAARAAISKAQGTDQ